MLGRIVDANLDTAVTHLFTSSLNFFRASPGAGTLLSHVEASLILYFSAVCALSIIAAYRAGTENSFIFLISVLNLPIIEFCIIFFD